MGLSGGVVGLERLGRKADPDVDVKAVPGVVIGSVRVSDWLLFRIFFGF